MGRNWERSSKMRRISLKNCPHCGCSTIYVSRSPTVWDRFYVVFLLRLVRCHVCMKRHFRPFFVRTPENPARDPARRMAPEVFPFKQGAGTYGAIPGASDRTKEKSFRQTIRR
jgi:hypothetical protein